jgi:ribosomal protein S27AE
MSALSVIHYPRVARNLAELTGWDYNTTCLDVVEGLMAAPQSKLMYRGREVLRTSSGACYYRSVNGQLYVVDTSQPCPSCGGSGSVPADHPDACHHLTEWEKRA